MGKCSLVALVFDGKGRVLETLALSSEFEVAIPESARDAPKRVAGQMLQVGAFENRIEHLPVRLMKKMKGFLKGIDASVPLEDERL